jgi:DNA-binding transcriptional regulator YhcF (GntR family)
MPIVKIQRIMWPRVSRVARVDLQFRGDGRYLAPRPEIDRWTETTMADDSPQPKTAAEALRVNEKKWTKALMDAGWTCVPSVIVERQQALGLDPIDINILMHLAAHWWTEDNKPYPSKGTIAKAIGVTPRTVQRRIARMEAASFIYREERRIAGKGSYTNRYHLDGLIKAAQPYAQEKMQERTARDEARKQAVTRKGKPRLRVVQNDE